MGDVSRHDLQYCSLPNSTLTDAAILDKGCAAGMIAARIAPGSVAL
jgi:hypothetical protein